MQSEFDNEAPIDIHTMPNQMRDRYLVKVKTPTTESTHKINTSTSEIQIKKETKKDDNKFQRFKLISEENVIQDFEDQSSNEAALIPTVPFAMTHHDIEYSQGPTPSAPMSIVEDNTKTDREPDKNDDPLDVN